MINFAQYRSHIVQCKWAIRFSPQGNSQQMLAVLLYSVNDEARKEGPHDLSVVRSRLRHFQVQKRGADTLRVH